MTTVISAVPGGLTKFGNKLVTWRDYQLSGTYAALVINASDVGMKFFDHVDIAGGDVSMGTYFPVFDMGSPATGFGEGNPTSVTLRFYTASGTVATGTLSPTINIRVMFMGG